MKGCVGGTFDILHQGHVTLLREALSRFDDLVVGVTSDEMAAERKARRIRHYDHRAAAVEAFLRKESSIPFEIVPLHDPFGPAVDPDMEGIVVSEETVEGARAINRLRGERGLTPLSVFVVELISIGGRKISARDYDTDEGPAVVLGSTNKDKTAGTRDAFLHLFPRVELSTVDTEPSVPPQPKDCDIFEGAYSRALQARQEAEGDFFVGIEAGLLTVLERPYNIHIAYVIGPGGLNSSGTSSGFLVPEGLLLKVEDGADLNEAAEQLRMEVEGSRTGTVDILSRGMLTRKAMCQQAVLSALIPLRNPLLYGSGQRTWPFVDEHFKKERGRLNVARRSSPSSSP